MGGAGAMSEPKPLASLNGSLLARKGGAKPAMRSQLMQPYSALGSHGGGSDSAQVLEDLGWNDMGDPQEVRHVADILPLTPAPANPAAEAEARAEDEAAAAQLAENAERIAMGQPLADSPAKPAVVRQQEGIIAKLNGNGLRPHKEAADTAPMASLADKPAKRASRRKPRGVALDGGRRAAFTLRLDAERHLKLRLACTVSNRSAQQVVTEALDRLLDEMPEIASLASQVRRH